MKIQDKTPQALPLPFMDAGISSEPEAHLGTQVSANRLSSLDPADIDWRNANPTRWDAAKPSPPEFDGKEGYDESLDRDRLKGQLLAVYDIMKDGKPRTIPELVTLVGKGSETGISTRVRDLRKEKFGGHIIKKRRRGDPKRGLFEYWLER